MKIRPTNARRAAALCGAAFLGMIALAATPAQALQVVTWNVTMYPSLDLAGRQPYFRTVMEALPADVMIVQEMQSQAGADSFLNVLQATQPKNWQRSFCFVCESAIYWDASKVSVTNISSFGDGGPRSVLYGVVKPLGYVSKQAFFRIYSMHLKAGGPGTPDSTTRRTECTNLRFFMNSGTHVNLSPNFILGGDSNFYGAYEGGYIRLTEDDPTYPNSRCKDPLDMPGDWHVQSVYEDYDTQAPCNGSFCPAGFSGGGMDDRFDLMLSSYSMQDGQGVDYVLPSGYVAFGNDGQHFDQSIDAGGNSAVGSTVAFALKVSSDHIPVVVTVRVASRVVAASALGFGDVITGATAQQNLAVSDGATAPADALDYSFSAPSGFSAPGGSFSVAAGDPANEHAIGMDTGSVGVRSGTLTVATDDPDSTSKPVQLSGRVLAHASPSLDSLAAVTATTLDLGDHTSGTFGDSAVRVHNLGYNALQARLSVDSGAITGGAGRFTLVGGFAGALLAGTGRSYSVHFDDSGATPDSTYEATLTFGSTDEALPGSTSRPDLVVTLRAQLLGPTGAPSAGLPTALRFYPPRPNPLSGETRFAFDLPKAAPVTLAIFDLSGRRVASLISETREAGRHDVRWRATDDAGARVPAGLYFARFATPGLARTQRIAVLP